MDKTDREVRQALIAIIKEATGIAEVIHGEDDGEQPNGTYASVKLITETELGIHSIVENSPVPQGVFFGFDGNGGGFDTATFKSDSESVFFHATIESQFIYSVQFWRAANVFDLARKLLRFRETPWGNGFIASLGVAIPEQEDAQDTSYKVAGRTVRHCSVTLTVHASTGEYREVNPIDEVTITVKDADSELEDTTFTVTKGE